MALEDESVIAETLSQTAGYKVRVVSRTRAERARFIKLASINAETALRSRLAHKSTITARYDQLEELLELERPIARMECFDISHTMGERTVASCVVFNREGPLSSEYRRFNIDGITGGDDYAAMEQALERRFGKQQEPDKVPDVLFIDGGLGQLRRAEEILARQLEFLGGKYPLLVGIAKGVTRKAGLETLIMGRATKSCICRQICPLCTLFNIFAMNPTVLPLPATVPDGPRPAPAAVWRIFRGWGQSGGRHCSNIWAACRRSKRRAWMNWPRYPASVRSWPRPSTMACTAPEQG